MLMQIILFSKRARPRFRYCPNSASGMSQRPDRCSWITIGIMTAYHIWLKEYLCLVAIEENNGFLTALKMRTQSAPFLEGVESIIRVCNDYFVEKDKDGPE